MANEIVKENAKESLRRALTRPSNVEIEQSLETLSQLMDNRFQMPVLGWRFGFDAIIGLVPGVGDTATSLVSLYILAAGVRYRVPKITLLRMGLNIALDYTIGSLPIVGDMFDAWWKSNMRNVELLRERATVSTGEARTGRASDWLFVGVIMIVLVALLAGSLTLVYLLLRFLLEHLPRSL